MVERYMFLAVGILCPHHSQTRIYTNLDIEVAVLLKISTPCRD